MSDGAKRQDSGPDERLTTGPISRTEGTSPTASTPTRSRLAQDVLLPCGRCRRELPVVQLDRLWRIPAKLIGLFRGPARNEAQGIYCPGCRRRLNWCITFLALLFVFWALILTGVLPEAKR